MIECPLEIRARRVAFQEREKGGWAFLKIFSTKLLTITNAG